MALHHLCQPLPAWHRCHRNRIHQWCWHSGGRGPRAGSCRPNSGRRGNHLRRFGRNRQQVSIRQRRYAGTQQHKHHTNPTPGVFLHLSNIAITIPPASSTILMAAPRPARC